MIFQRSLIQIFCIRTEIMQEDRVKPCPLPHLPATAAAEMTEMGEEQTLTRLANIY